MQGDPVGQVGTVPALMECLESLGGGTGRDTPSGLEESGCCQRDRDVAPKSR